MLRLPQRWVPGELNTPPPTSGLFLFILSHTQLCVQGSLLNVFSRQYAKSGMNWGLTSHLQSVHPITYIIFLVQSILLQETQEASSKVPSIQL